MNKVDDIDVFEAEHEMDEFFERQVQYAKYVAHRIDTTCSFKDWYEQTYNKTISRDEVEASIEAIRDDVLDIIEEQLMELNGC